MEFMDLVKARYSCRKFTEQAVENDKLQMILEAGRLAPTATNAQPVRIYAVKSADAVAKLRGITRMAYNAPLLLLVCYDENVSWKAKNYNDDFDGGIMDCSIVATHIMLRATELGLNTLWARGFNASEIERAFDLPQNMKLACMIDVGYADPEQGGPSPRHPVRKEMSEFVTEL